MGLAIRDRTETTLSEINVTPLVDVMLVLLIIFMVTTPMLSASVEVDLEQASVAPVGDPEEHLIVSVTADGRVYVADELTDLAILDRRVLEQMRSSGLRNVAIRGDKQVAYGAVLQVLDRLQAAGVGEVGLVMQPPPIEPTPGER